MRADFGTRDGVQAGPGGGAPPAGRLAGRRPAGSGDRGPGAFGRRVLPTLVLLWAFSLAVASCGGGGQGPAGASGALSLDEYLEFCGDTVTEANSLDGSGSVGEFSEAAEQAVDLMEQVDPPAEVADWHNAMLAYVRALKETLDEIPQSAGGDSEEAFLVLTILELVFEHRPSFEQAISGMDPGVRSQMVDAGCMDELDAEQAASTVRPEPGDGRDAEPEATEEHEEPARPEPGDGDGAEQEAADEEEEAVESEELLVGQSAEGRLDGPLEVDRFWVWAEAGEKYVLEADWRGMRNLRVRISRSPGYNWINRLEDPPFFTVWEPEASGVYDISVESDDAPGSYTIAVSEDPRPDPPPNQRYSWDGPEVTVTWDPAQDADRYNVYYGDGGRCEAGGREQPRWCEIVGRRCGGHGPYRCFQRRAQPLRTRLFLGGGMQQRGVLRGRLGQPGCAGRGDSRGSLGCGVQLGGHGCSRQLGLGRGGRPLQRLLQRFLRRQLQGGRLRARLLRPAGLRCG